MRDKISQKWLTERKKERKRERKRERGGIRLLYKCRNVKSIKIQSSFFPEYIQSINTSKIIDFSALTFLSMVLIE